MSKENKEPTSCDINAKNSCCSSETSNNDLKTHWDNAYENSSIDRLGWYEENPIPSLQLIEKSGINKNATLLNVGAGATTLVDELRAVVCFHDTAAPLWGRPLSPFLKEQSDDPARTRM